MDNSHKDVIYFSLGSNLGDRMANLKIGMSSLSRSFDFISASHIVESVSWGYDDPNPYLNMVAGFSADNTPKEIRERIAEIEIKAGRKHSGQSTSNYEARTLDIDVLFYGDLISDNPDILIPHPRLHLRNFVLEPLVQLAPDLTHPILKKNMLALFEASSDKSVVKHYADGV